MLWVFQVWNEFPFPRSIAPAGTSSVECAIIWQGYQNEAHLQECSTWRATRFRVGSVQAPERGAQTGSLREAAPPGMAYSKAGVS
jgi:hypothetical protein